MTDIDRKNLLHRYEPRPEPEGGRIPSEPTRPDLASRSETEHAELNAEALDLVEVVKAPT